MASNVAQPLERQFSLIAGLSQMTSTSGLGSTQITLQFDLDRSIDAAASTCRPPSTHPPASCPPTCRARPPSAR